MVEIRKYFGYRILYQDQEFILLDEKGAEVTKASSESLLTAYVDKIRRKTTVRLKVLHQHYAHGALEPGEITSLTPSAYRVGGFDVWWVKDEGGREKENVSYNSFYVATPENLIIADKIAEKAKAVKAIEDEIDALKQQLETRVRDDNVEELLGIKGPKDEAAKS